MNNPEANPEKGGGGRDVLEQKEEAQQKQQLVELLKNKEIEINNLKETV